MTPKEQLCEKMRVEQSAYCLWLTAQPPEEILHHAYEYQPTLTEGICIIIL